MVLGVMAEQGLISAEDVTAARARPLDLNTEGNIRGAVPAYLDLVRRQLRQEYREEDLTTRGLSIFTAFDPLLQRQLSAARQPCWINWIPPANCRPHRWSPGLIRRGRHALVGGRTARFAGFNRALDARRPAGGSLLKSAIYLAAWSSPSSTRWRRCCRHAYHYQGGRREGVAATELR
ncbi:MAG: hypothetical protein IPG64_11625 [Haliea sp.]|nr:hypothetical protein [Haliea sp.]